MTESGVRESEGGTRPGAAESTADGPGAGARVGEHILEELLGEGGCGRVWRARHATLPGRVVAVKLPRDPELIELLRRESLLQHGLDHPGVLRILDARLDGDPPHIVQEYAAGGDLAALLERHGALPPTRALALFREIVAIVAYAHSRGVVHGDLKPGNLLLDSTGRVRVGDFGLGRGVQAVTRSYGGEGVRSLSVLPERLRKGGTWEYMSPEHRAYAGGEPGAEAPDARADVFALGIILHELLTGRRPAGRVGLEAVSPAIDRVFARCWAPIERRFGDARELLAALDDALASEDWGSAARSDDSRRREVVRDASARRPESTGKGKKRSRKARPVYAPMGALVVRTLILAPLLVLLGFGYFYWVADGVLPARWRRASSSGAPTSDGRGAPTGDAIDRVESAGLDEIVAAIRRAPEDIEGALTRLGRFVLATHDSRARARAEGLRRTILASAEEREQVVREVSFHVEADAWDASERRLEIGPPEVYVAVVRTRDGRDEAVASTREWAVEGWDGAWSGDERPELRFSWKVGDGLRLELRDRDVLEDDVIATTECAGGLSILLLDGEVELEGGHRLRFVADPPGER